MAEGVMIKLYGRENPHPRGLIGEIIANQLLQAGWKQTEMAGYPDWWIGPDGQSIGPLDTAKQHYDMLEMGKSEDT